MGGNPEGALAFCGKDFGDAERVWRTTSKR